MLWPIRKSQYLEQTLEIDGGFRFNREEPGAIGGAIADKMLTSTKLISV